MPIDGEPQTQQWSTIILKRYSAIYSKIRTYTAFAWTGPPQYMIAFLRSFFSASIQCFFMFIRILPNANVSSNSFRGPKLQQQNSFTLFIMNIFPHFYMLFILRKCNFLSPNKYVCASASTYCDGHFIPEFYWYLFNDFVCCFGILSYQNSFRGNKRAKMLMKNRILANIFPFVRRKKKNIKRELWYNSLTMHGDGQTKKEQNKTKDKQRRVRMGSTVER